MLRLRFLIPLVMVLLSLGPSAAAQSEVTVLSYNVLGGGNQSDVDAILAAGADIIGIQEGGNSTLTMANLLGYNGHVLSDSQRGSSNGIITRFDITDTYDNGVQIDMGALGLAYIFSVHLTSCPYQPYELHPQAGALGCGSPINTGSDAGDVAQAVARANSARAGQIGVVLNEIAANVPDGAPVFLVGDFNEPSHLDWTAAAGPDGTGDHTHVVPWPTSITVTDAGFIDTYRDILPDETADLGYTWTTNDPSLEVHDRIDFVYYQGEGLALTDVQLVGDTGSAGGVSSDIALSNYSSDHRAVAARFAFPEPGEPGDITGDGFVGVEDLDVLLAHWGDSVAAYDRSAGDLSGDALVGQADLDLVIANWSDGTPPDVNIPEPGTLALLVVGACIGCRRR
ncbi:endonuclease/exonuclease/phosphatase family protein [Phycisphaeraceae bacterium D3-23]